MSNATAKPASEPSPPAASQQSPQDSVIEIRGSAVVTVGSLRVSVAAIADGARQRADGTSERVPCVQLLVEGRGMIEATVGESVEIGGTPYRIQTIEKPLLGTRRIVLVSAQRGTADRPPHAT